MSTIVCFTGKANVLGNPILRKDFESAVQSLGWATTEKPGGYVGADDRILVATRDNTQKAKAAKSMGWTIMSPEEFAGHLHMNGIADLAAADGSVIDLASLHQAEAQARKRAAQKARDANRAEAKRLQEQREREMAAMADNPMFGEWS
ncbi:MAG: hypothetical protein VX267_00485 [Candidatus Thermoplasmatota archaeon]|nr:hypothetical protein [Candidatus Thermoplasmatota archaeon]